MPLNGVLLTTDAVGGVWRYSADLALGLRQRDRRCMLAVLGPPPTPAQRAEVQGIEVIATGLPLDWTAAHPAELDAAADALARLSALVGASSIHLHSPALVGQASWHVPVVAVSHSCVGTWWQAVRGGPLPDDLAWRAAATGQGMRRAAAVVAPTQAHAQAVQNFYGPIRIAAIHNGVVPAPAPAGPRGRAVLTAGRLWDEGKGAALLDRAAASLDAPVRAAGPTEGPNGAAIALKHLHHLGTLDRDGMRHAQASARVFASMARYEPFGLAVLEAAQAGMHLVLSDIPTFRELWDGAATFVSDPAELPAALHRALDTPGDGGAAQRAARFSIGATVDATLDLHRSLCT